VPVQVDFAVAVQGAGEAGAAELFSVVGEVCLGEPCRPVRGGDRARLLDELRMFRYPVVVGGGTPFLPSRTEKVRLDLVEARTFGSRVIYERYGRVRVESDRTVL
jgi:hypothetical protein